MKLHLPVRLFRAVIALMAALPALTQAYDIPEEYDQLIDLWTPSYIFDHISNTAEDYKAFSLYTDIEFNPTANTTWTATTPLVTGGNLIFTTAAGYAPMALTFSKGTDLAFNLTTATDLTFDTLSHLKFADIVREEQATSSSNQFYGGAVYLGSNAALTIHQVNDATENTTDVLFSGNRLNVKNSSFTPFVYGGAIYGASDSSIDISGNGDVAFDNNSSFTSTISQNSYGGAIYSAGHIFFVENGNISFNNNYTKGYDYDTDSTYAYARGGAVYSGNNITISGNKDVSFDNNYAYAYAYAQTNNAPYGAALSVGGALCLSKGLDLTNNDNIRLKGNYTYSSSRSCDNSPNYYSRSLGGAIYSDSIININNNKNILIEQNYAEAARLYASSATARGGAIYSTATLRICNNVEVTFIGNYTNNKYSANYEGGAIYSTGSIIIEGNDDVVFEKNYERYGSSSYTYRLRSIYMDPDAAADTLVLSAKEGKSITFYDTVYMDAVSSGVVKFNADYVDEDGVTQKATGDIVFSGAKAAEHLKEIKGSAATSAELNDSQTTTINNAITLYGGTLQVVDGAKFNGRALTLAANSDSNLLMRNAMMLRSGYDITFNNKTELELQGYNTVSASGLYLNKGSTLTTSVGAGNRNTAALTLTGYLCTYEHTINLERTDGLTSGMFKVITLASGSSYFKTTSNWTADNVTVNGSGYANRMIFSDLVWKDGVLYYNVGRNIWSNASEDRLWNGSSDNWTMNARSYTYIDGMDVYFTDTGAGQVKLVGDIDAASIEVNNAAGKDYHFTAAESGGKLVGATGILKNGAGTLTIDTANEHTGVTKLNTGTLNVHHSTALGDTTNAETATVTTAAGTLLAVDKNSHVVLAGENDMAGAVSVAEGSTLELRNTGYHAESSDIDGTLHFRGEATAMSNVGKLSGNGTVKVEDSTITFSQQTAYTGKLMIVGANAKLSITQGHYNAAGYIALNGEGAALNMSSNNLDLKAGGSMSMVTTGTTTMLTANNVRFAAGAGLTVRHDGSTEALTMSCYNESVAGTMNVAKLTLDSGSYYTADGGHLSLDNGELTLAITPTAAQKIHLTLTAGENYNTDERVCLFSGISTMNFIYDGITTTTENYTLDAEDYFSGDWINADTMLVYENGSLYLTWVNSVGVASDTVAWSNATGDFCWNTTSQNWSQDSTNGVYKNNLAVVFGDTAAGEITLEGEIAPANVLVNNNYGYDYSWVGAGSLMGSMSLTKQGAGTLTISTANSYRGGTTIEGGSVVALHADALGTGVIQLNGGTLEIGVAGVDNTIRSAGRSSLVVSEGVTHTLLGTINNSGTLSMSGNFNADALGDMVQLGAVSLVNAAGEADTTGGFNKSALQGVQIATGSTVNLGTTITHGKNVLHLGTDGWATMGGLVEYSGYLIGNKHNVKLSDINTAATAGGATMTNIQLNGGTLTADAALTGVLAASGTSSILAQDWQVSEAFSNSGTLTISGTIIADGIDNMEVIGATHVAADGSVGSSGFSKNDGSKFTLVLGGGVTATDLSITRDGLAYTLGSDGVAVADGAVAYGRYLVGDKHSVKLSDIVAAAVTNGVSKTHVDLNGGTLTLDRAMTGSLSAAGNSSIIAQNWAVNEAITNSGELTLRGTVIADALAVDTIGATYVDAAGHVGEHGFTRAEGYQFTLIDGGTLVNKGVHITRNGIEYELESNGVAVAHGDVVYGSYIIGAGHAVKLSEIVAAAAAHGVSSTEIVLNGGTLTADTALTGLLSIGGESTIVAQNFVLLDTIANSGVLTLSGTMDAGNIELVETAAARESLNGEVVSANESGFAKAESYTALLVEGGEVVNKGLVIDHSGLKAGLSLQLGSDGVAHAGGAVDYTTYYLTGEGVADVVGIASVARKQGGQLNDIAMDGGTLTVNADATVTATGGAILLNGGALNGHLSGTVVHATEGTLNASLLGGNTLVGNQYALNKVILNSGTLTVSGSFDVSALTLHSTGVSYLDTNGKTGNSGFLKGAEQSVLVVSGGSVNGLATVKHNGVTLTLGSDGYAKAGGSVAYGTYYLNGSDSVSVSAAEAASNNALSSVNMTGGVLYADASTTVQASGGSIMLSSGTLMGTARNTAVSAKAGTLNAALSGSSSLTLLGTVTVSGTNSHSGGTVLTGGNITLSNAQALGNGSVIATGNNVLQAGTTITLKSTIFNNGELTLNGSYDVSALTLQTRGSGYVDTAGNMGESGFATADGYSVLVVSGGNVISNASIKHGNMTLTLGSDGYATSGGSVEYDTYYLNSGDSVSVLAAEAASGNALTTISMNGGTLYADASTAVASKGGSIVLSNGTLSGSIENAVVSATNGSLSATLTGSTSVQVNGTVTLSGANTHTGGTIINGGTLTIAHSSALGNGALLNKGNGMLKADAVLTLSEAIINNGTLTLSGSYDVSALDIITAGAVRLDVNGNAGNSGFLKSGGSKVLVVNGGTVINSGAVITHEGTTLTLGSDGYATSGGSINYRDYLLTGTDTAATSAIHTKNSAATITQNGGTLTVDDAAMVTSTGGTINLADGTLNGTVSGATIHASKGALSAELNGSNTLIGYDYSLGTVLNNSGVLTLSGTFAVQQLTTNEAATYVGLDNRNGADGFRKSAYMVATLSTGTTADAGALITYGDTELKLQANGTASAGGEIDYSTFYLNSGAASSQAIHNKASACGITVVGGALTINDTATVTATGGNITLNGGVLLGSVENTVLTLTRGTLDATVNGGSVIGSSYVLSEALELNGSVRISGSFDASALELITTDRARVDVVTGNSGESGFLKLGDSRVQVISGGNLTIDGNTTVKYNGLTLTMGNDGYASAGGTTDYSTYLLTGSDRVNAQSVLRVAPTAAIEMNGGTLTVDASVDQFTATGGTIELSNNVKLGGAISGTTINATTGNISATLTGSNTLVGNNYALNNVINNSGVLTLSGSFTVSSLTANEEATYIGLNNSAGSSGFRKDAYLSATIATGTTADAGATISYRGTVLKLNTDGTASTGGTIDYSRYYLNDGAANTQAIHAKSTGCGISVTGGTLTVNDSATVTATGGSVILNGGTLHGNLQNTNLTLTRGTLLSTINGGSVNGNNYLLNGVIQLNGNVNISGTFNATALDLISEGATRVDVFGNSGASGFSKTGEMRVKVINGGVLNVANDASVTHGSHALTLGSDGYATGGGTVDYSEYLLTGADSVNVSDIYAKNSNATITQTGGILRVDTTADVVTTTGSVMLSNGTLSGTLTNADVSATGGTLRAVLSGTSTLTAKGTVTISGANTHTGGTIFNGGTFTLSQTNALGSGSVVMSGTNTLYATTNVHLGYVLLNSGNLTLTGTFNASDLALNEINSCHVDTDGNVSSSGFRKASGYSVQIVSGGTVSGNATIKHGNLTLTLGSDGYATSGGGVAYGTYYLNNGDSVSVIAAETASSNALNTIIMDGGTLYADATTKVTATGGNILLSNGTLSGSISNTSVTATAGTISATLSGTSSLSAKGSMTISGANTHTGGTIFNGGYFTLSHANAMGNGSVMSIGTNTIYAATAQALKSTILNSGTLTLSGSWNLSALSLTTTAATRVDADGRTGNSGFAKSARYEVQVVMGGTSKGSDLLLTHNKLAGGLQLQLGSNGIATAGGEIDYTTYYLSGNDSISVSDATNASGGALDNIMMDGGKLTLDASAEVNATGGSIHITDDAILSGSIIDTDIFLADGAYSGNISADITGDSSLTINGGDITLSGDNNYTGGTIINGGNVTTSDSTVLGSGSVTVNGGTLDLNNENINNDIILNDGHLTGNDNYNGNLSIGGDNVTVEGGYTLGAGNVLTVAVGGTEFGSDLTLAGGTLLFEGSPLTVDGEVSFTAGTTTRVNLSQWAGQLTDGLTLAVFGEDVTGWTESSMELIGMSGMSLVFDQSSGTLTLQIAGQKPATEVISWLGASKAVWQHGKAGWMNATTGYDAVFENGMDVIFTQPGTVTIAGTVEAGSIIIAGDKAISFKSDKVNPGRIAGDASLTKRGNGKLTLNDGNTYTGGTLIEAGTVITGGDTSFGSGNITLMGGVLDLKSKAVNNDIELTGAATIKAGKNYKGSAILDGDLIKGSVLNVAANETVTLKSGTMNGTLSGVGAVEVVGNATLGTTGKITTDKLNIGGTLNVSSKGLAMNTKTSVLTVNSGGLLLSEGTLKAYSITINGGNVDVHGIKASTVALTSNLQMKNAATMNVFGNLSAANITLSSNSVLTLNGKLSATNLTLRGATVTFSAPKLTTVAVKNQLTLSGSNTVVFDFDATTGSTYKLFTFAGISYSGTLEKLLGWEKDDCYTLNNTGKAITLTVNDADTWEEYMDSLLTGTATTAAEEEAEDILFAPATTAGALAPELKKAADTLVQSTWGAVGASRAFGDTISNRGAHATQLEGGKGTAWISTMGGSSRISSDADHAGADYTLTGAAFGMEVNISADSTLGIAIGNSWGKVSTFSAYPVDQDSTHAGIYGNHKLNDTFSLNWMAAHTRTESDVTLAGLPCSWSQETLQLDARLTWAKALNARTTVNAFGGLQYLATDSGECNGIKSGSLQNLRAEIGVGATHRFTGNTMAYGELSFIGDVVRNNPTADLGNIRSHGTNPGRAGMNLSVGASHRLNDDWSVNASYNMELMQNITSHSLNIGATYSF